MTSRQIFYTASAASLLCFIGAAIAWESTVRREPILVTSNPPKIIWAKHGENLEAKLGIMNQSLSGIWVQPIRNIKETACCSISGPDTSVFVGPMKSVTLTYPFTVHLRTRGELWIPLRFSYKTHEGRFTISRTTKLVIMPN